MENNKLDEHTKNTIIVAGVVGFIAGVCIMEIIEIVIEWIMR